LLDNYCDKIGIQIILDLINEFIIFYNELKIGLFIFD